MIEKPPFGSPCNGCGHCCREELCMIAAATFPGASAPCPAIRGDGERKVCGLVVAPEAYAPILTAIYGPFAMSHAAKTLLGVGKGCDAEADGEMASEADHAIMDAKYEKVPKILVMACMSIWRIGA